MKKFFYGMIALSVSLFFLGCSQDSEEETITTKTAAETLAEADDLTGKVDVDGNVVTLNTDVTVAGTVTVPADVTLKVPKDKTLTVTGTLTVNGTLSGEVGTGTPLTVATVTVVAGATVTYSVGGSSVTIPAGTYVWTADAGGGTAGWLESLASSAYTAAQQGNVDSDETTASTHVTVGTALKNPITNTVILKLTGTFDAAYTVTVETDGSDATGEHWNGGDEWGDLDDYNPPDGVYGVVNIGGLFPQVQTNIAVHIKPYAGLLFYTGNPYADLNNTSVLTGPSLEKPFNHLSTTESENERWKLYPQFAADALFDVLLYSAAATKTVTLDIDKYAVTTVDDVQTVGARESHYLNVIIDYSEVNFTAPAD